MSSTDPVMIICPACTTANRVPRDKLAAGGKCGRCGGTLFAAHPVELNARNFDAHLARSGIPLLVDFWAAWCGPCRQMAPAFEAAAAKLEPHVRLDKLDTEAEQVIAARFAIRSIPTMILLRAVKRLPVNPGQCPQVQSSVGCSKYWGNRKIPFTIPPGANLDQTVACKMWERMWYRSAEIFDLSN